MARRRAKLDYHARREDRTKECARLTKISQRSGCSPFGHGLRHRGRGQAKLEHAAASLTRRISHGAALCLGHSPRDGEAEPGAAAGIEPSSRAIERLEDPL